jgi:hypothetical protein
MKFKIEHHVPSVAFIEADNADQAEKLFRKDMPTNVQIKCISPAEMQQQPGLYYGAPTKDISEIYK